MIYNGHDYQPHSAVYSTTLAVGEIYFYFYLGDTFNSNWAVEHPTSNVNDTAIDSVDGHWYVFVHCVYSSEGVFDDSIDIRISWTPPGASKFISWTTIVGYEEYEGPIWKDYIYTVPIQAARVKYKIKYNGNAIYKGWSYEMDYTNQIIINEICRNYLSTNFPTAQNVWYQDYNAEKTFDLCIGLGEDEEPDTKVADVKFIYDWSYDEDYTADPSEAWLAMEPLQNFYDTRQLHIFSVNDEATLTDTHSYSYVNTRTGRNLLCVKLPPSTAYLYSRNGNYRRVFEIQANCGMRYCLYYVNSRGGWDSVLVDGNSLQTDKYSRNTFTQNYITPSIYRGVVEYRNNIKETWTLYLRSLGDDKNPRFHNLFESTQVLLHDLETDEIIPVVIKSVEMQYKTRRNQNNKKNYSYQILVESAQQKLRM